MSRQLFLAELTQYLTFISPKERNYIISALSAKFDEVGTQGEPELLMELGTPMSIAIALKRRKEAGDTLCPEGAGDDSSGEGGGSEEQSAAGEVPAAPPVYGLMGHQPTEAAKGREKSPSKPSAQETLVKELLAEEQDGSDRVEDRADAILEEDNRLEAQPEQPSVPPERDAVEYSDDYEEVYPEDGYIPAITSEGTARIIEAPVPVPRKTLTPAGIVGASLLSIVVAALMGLIAALGAALCYCGLNLLFAGLSTMSTLNDALWMFAVGMGLVALGLFFLWLGIWGAICIIHSLFLGRAVEGSNFKKGMSKLSKTMLTLAGVLLVVGVGCGVGSYLSGGYIDIAFKNHAAVDALARIEKGPLSFIFKLIS